jgi:hypothetical protein
MNEKETLERIKKNEREFENSIRAYFIIMAVALVATIVYFSLFYEA